MTPISTGDLIPEKQLYQKGGGGREREEEEEEDKRYL